MSHLTALAALLSLLRALELYVASLSTTVACHFTLVVIIGAATSVAVTSTPAVTAAASTTAATAADPTSSRVLVSLSISPGVRSLAPVCLGF